jgi:hypothetical protein
MRIELKKNNSIAMNKVVKPYTLVGFEPTIFCSDGGDNDHYIHLASRALQLDFIMSRRTDFNITSI